MSPGRSVRLEREDGLAVVTFDSPPLNLFDEAMGTGLSDLTSCRDRPGAGARDDGPTLRREHTGALERRLTHGHEPPESFFPWYLYRVLGSGALALPV